MTLETTARSSEAGNASLAAGALSVEHVAELRNLFHAEPRNLLAQNAVTRAAIDDIAVNREVVTSTDHTFSHLLDKWAVTDQKQSGRCWLFAGMNLFRVGAMEKMGFKDFEFSQTYLFFWDKFDRRWRRHDATFIVQDFRRDLQWFPGLLRQAVRKVDTFDPCCKS